MRRVTKILGTYNTPARFISGNPEFLEVLLLPSGPIEYGHSPRQSDMSINSIWQLAQVKLATECMREDHNLLRVVGHANLLYSLAASEEQTQRFEEEFGASNTAKFGHWRAQFKQLYTLSERLCSNLAPSCVAVMELTPSGPRR